jgi:hypothetical protein
MAKNLTTVDGTYSKELLANFKIIETAYKNPKSSAKDFMSMVETIVAPAKDTKAKATFISRLKSKTSKYDIWWLVYSATTAGMLY